MNRFHVFRWLPLWAIAIVVIFSPQVASADEAADGVLNPIELSRAGLHRVWTTQAEINAADKVKFAQLHVSHSRATVFFEIFAGDDLRRSFASLDRDALGNRLGYERAKELAEMQREIIEQEVAASLADPKMPQAEFNELIYGTSPEAIQKRQQLLEQHKQKVEVRKYVEPRMTLYVLNGHNVLQAFDAETGDLRWSTQVGPREGWSTGIAANDAMVTVVNGQRIYCLDADQGRILWNRRCYLPPNAPPAMSHTHIFVPLLDGKVESYGIESDGMDVGYYVSYGHITAQPLVTGRTVSWPTDKGHYNVAYFDEIGSLKYRIRAHGAIVAMPAKLGRVLFVAAMDGYVYAVDEVLGTIYWEFSSGSSISKQPLAVSDEVYFVTDNNELFKLDGKTGATDPAWPKSIPGIRQLIGAAGNYVYVEDTSGNLVLIRTDSGAKESSVYIGEGNHLLNSQTDRIFLISNSGNLQCLRQNAQVHPDFHVPVSEAITSMETSGTLDKKAMRKRTAIQLDETIRNPFETKEELSQDPFIAAEPVYKNPFLVESEGEVNPFTLDQEKAPDAKGDKTDAAQPEAEPKPDQPPSDSDDPFKGGNP